ncbi:hypothetical protein Tagg_0894 [Thermosphaera aggregans DSM 11486]|jgi:hypothetical protein|uniref:Uncharacterized protein n=2 Tax=Thermosphaera aggregans TaxID=54254 RepID=D5U216_THEAM|nr:hypothetical protein Tagg_0894 [Thermosphaera aggregans DSM 11486]
MEKGRKALIYLALATALLVLSILFLLWSISYMERGRIATSLVSALAGFSLLSAALYALRLSAYIYGVEKSEQ